MTWDAVLKRVKAKKYVTVKINESQAMLSTFKDKTGIIYGMLILPVTCGVLNWAYPKIMKKLFPKLSASKQAKKDAQNQKYKAQTPSTKEVK